MVSQLKVNEIITQSGSTLSLGQSGDTLSVTTGALQSNVLYPAWSVELSDTKQFLQVRPQKLS